MGVAYSTHGEIRSAYQILVGKLNGSTPLSRPRIRLAYDMKKGLKTVFGMGMWLGFTWLRKRNSGVIVNREINLLLV